jgi:hypothetical protein
MACHCMTDDDDTDVGFGLDDPSDLAIERMHDQLVGAEPLLLPPLGWLCAVIADLGTVAELGQRFAAAHVQSAHGAVIETPDEAWVESLMRLGATALRAADAHSLHTVPGQPLDPEILLGLAFQCLRELVRVRGWHIGEPTVWTARLSEQVGSYASSLLASPEAAPTEVGRTGEASLHLAGPAALAVAGAAMLAASATLRDA